MGDIWNNNPQTIERLGTGEEFHSNIVNYNVRIFFRFLSDTISNGGFKPFTRDFNQKHGKKYYTTILYQKQEDYYVKKLLIIFINYLF